jgi:DNA (cytosine-5)-methyltransferase 1
MQYRFIDLFAGIGGFHEAFHRVEAKCVFVSEWDKAARLTYEHNFRVKSPELFGDVDTPGQETQFFVGDITKVDKEKIPVFDVLCAGFPCQPFSQAGHKLGFKDDRGNLFYEICEIIQTKIDQGNKPRAIFLENVRHLHKHDGGRTFETILKVLTEELGYFVTYKIVKASEYGLPQLRPRLFIICFAEKTDFDNFEQPIPMDPQFTMSELLGGECPREIGFTLRVGGKASPIADRHNWDGYFVDGQVRRLTPDEGKLMQGYDRNFRFPSTVPSTQAMKQLGNGVAVNAIEAYARAIVNSFKQTDAHY